jgi:hypothetical protein
VEFKENGQQLAVKWHDKQDFHVLFTVHIATMSGHRKDRPPDGREKNQTRLCG